MLADRVFTEECSREDQREEERKAVLRPISKPNDGEVAILLANFWLLMLAFEA